MSEIYGRPLLELAQADFQLLCRFLLEKTGMLFDESKFIIVRSVISDRIQATGSGTFERYYNFISQNISLPNPNLNAQNEFRRLVEALAVNETSFFRNKDHFKALHHEVLPRLIKRNAKKREIRIWSAGCSTGQEAYSLAMLITEVFEEKGEPIASQPDDRFGWKVRIFASDISEKVMQQGKSGRFRREDLRGLDKERLDRFFRPISPGDGEVSQSDPLLTKGFGQNMPAKFGGRAAFEIVPEVRSLVSFDYFNLTEKTYPPQFNKAFDIILCENVMIYFTPVVVRQVIENMYKSICEGGFLFIGFSETLWQVSESFRLINTDASFYYQKPFPNDPPPQRLSRSVPATGPLNLLELNKHLKSNLPDIVSNSTNPSGNKVESPVQKKPGLAASKNSVQEALSPHNSGRSNSAPPVVHHAASRSTRLHTGMLLRGGHSARLGHSKENRLETTNRNNCHEILNKGLSFMQEHDFENAAKVLEEAVLCGSRDIDTLMAMAQLKVILGQNEAAKNYSRKAISVNPLCEPAHLLLALIFHGEERLEEAVKEYQQSIYINSDSVIAHMRLGDIKLKQGHNGNALREYRNALMSLDKYQLTDYIEGFPVEILKQTCQNNISRLCKKVGLE